MQPFLIAIVTLHLTRNLLAFSFSCSRKLRIFKKLYREKAKMLTVKRGCYSFLYSGFFAVPRLRIGY